MSEILKNPYQVHQYLRGEGWQCSYNKVKADIERSLLRPRRGGGFSAGTVDAYATAHLVRQVDVAPGQDRPVGGGQAEADASGVASRRTMAHAQKLEIQQKREALKLQQELGQLVETATVEGELAARAKAFRLGLEAFGHDASERVAAVFGGEDEGARELCEALGLGEDMVPVVVDFIHSRTPRFRRLWGGLVEDFLDPYATGAWWTDAMRDAWERREDAGEVPHA